MAAFEADIEPRTRSPRLRSNFENGWSASIVLNMSANPTVALCASTAACPTGKWGKRLTEAGPQEASADEVAKFLGETSARPAP